MRSNITKQYIPQLDGLRGLAIILVVTFHYFGNYAAFSFGWSGVDLFFVLSGYLITSRLIALQQKKSPLKKFYINRALRILPIYYLVLAVFYLSFNLLVKKENFHLFTFYNRNWASFVFFVQNWSMIFSSGVKENFLDHFWSLAVEEQFYLLWPWFLYFFWQKKYFAKLILVIIALIIIYRSLIFFYYPAWQDYRHYFYNTFCRMDGFLIGSVLFIRHKKDEQSINTNCYFAAFLCIIAGIFFTRSASGISNPFFDTMGFTIIAIFFAGLIDVIINNSSKVALSIFNWRWLKFTGKISYGFYIFHWLILIAFQQRFVNWFTQKANFTNTTATIVSAFICISMSYLISVISYRYYESYLLRKKLH